MSYIITSTDLQSLFRRLKFNSFDSTICTMKWSQVHRIHRIHRSCHCLRAPFLSSMLWLQNWRLGETVLQVSSDRIGFFRWFKALHTFAYLNQRMTTWIRWKTMENLLCQKDNALRKGLPMPSTVDKARAKSITACLCFHIISLIDLY